MTTLVISDLHLGARNSRRDLIARLLRSKFDRLILNGDTINSLDFRQFQNADWRIVELLHGISRRGELVLIRGNHDGLAKDEGGVSFGVLADLLETEMYEEYEVQTSAGRLLVLHGDQFDYTMNLTWVGDAADWCYNRMQRVSRPTARWLKARVKHVAGVVDCVSRGATAWAAERGCVGAITGHTHYPDDEWVNGVRYLNTGCWVDLPCSYVRIANGQARLEFWGEQEVPSQPDRAVLCQA